MANPVNVHLLIPSGKCKANGLLSSLDAADTKCSVHVDGIIVSKIEDRSCDHEEYLPTTIKSQQPNECATE